MEHSLIMSIARTYKDWDKFFLAMKDDKPIMKVIDLIKHLLQGRTLS